MSDETRIAELVQLAEDLGAQGQPDPVAAACRDFPGLAEDVGRQFRALRSISELLKSTPDKSLADTHGRPISGQPAEPEPLPRTLGRYQLQERLGEGGFGQVWRAYDPELERLVAIKVPRCASLAQAGRAEAFLREAQKVARLSHPGIVPVYDVGREGPYFYFVSELIEGSSLADRMRGGRLPFAEAAHIVAQVAEALHHAHLHDLVHRDIKPGNILLDKQGRPYLTDFGIAATEDELLEQQDLVSGTLPYMAPEQIAGENERVTGRTDVYSLGVVLYELLTGRLPFSAKKTVDLRRQIGLGEPRPPRTIDDSVPSWLEHICLKAMAREPANRYSTARDAAQELHRGSRPARPQRLVIAAAIGTLLLMVPTFVLLTLAFSTPRRNGEQSQARGEQPIPTPHPSMQSSATVEVPKNGAAKLRIEAALNSPTEIPFIETPLSDVVEYLMNYHGILIFIDEKALDRAGLGCDLPVTINVKGISLRSALREMLGKLNLTYTFDNEMLVITTPESAESRLITKAYVVSELVLPPVASGEQADNPDLTDLIDVILATVRPTSWDVVGGPCSVQQVPNRLLVVVSQTQEGHEDTADLLAKLRDADYRYCSIPKGTNAFEKECREYLSKQDYDGAIDHCTRSIRLNPHHAEAYFCRAVGYEGKAVAESGPLAPGKVGARANACIDNAISDLSEAIRLNPRCVEAYARRGYMHKLKGDRDKNIADFREAVRVAAGMVYLARGYSYLLKHKYDNAVADITEAIRLNPMDAEAFLDRGVAHEQMGDLDKAIADFSDAVRLTPDSAQGHYLRARAYDDKGDYANAILDYSEAIRMNPSFAQAYSGRGACYSKTGETGRAEEDLAEARRLGSRPK